MLTKEKKRKDDDFLYCDIHFIMVAWNSTHNILEFCLYS